MAMWGLCLNVYCSPPWPIEDSIAQVRTALTAINQDGGFEGAPCVPESPATQETLIAARDAAFETSFKPISFLHPSPSDGISWDLGISQAYDPDLGWAALSFAVSLKPDDRRGVTKAWRFLQQTAPHVIEALKPRFGLINGTGEFGIKFRNFDAHALPPVMTPWTWIGSEMLTEERLALLAALPDCSVAPLAGGLLLRFVPDFYTKPTPALLAAVRKLPASTPIKYRQSVPPDAYT